MSEKALQTLKILKDGGIAVFPTDTAYGIGCRIDNHKTIDRLFTIRKRPITKATPVLVSSVSEALKYYKDPSVITKSFMDKYWPGAVTIVAPVRKSKIYSPLRGGGDTIGLRMPNHTELLEVIRLLGVPIVGTSANIHGEKTPFSSSDLDQELIKNVDYVWEGSRGSGEVSTVVESFQLDFKILRQGSVIIL